MLYKEVVVNNFASFFLGVDDPIREHHHGCTDHPTTQTRLCHLVKKKDGAGYNCPRHHHPHQIDNQVNHLSDTTPTPFALYHKQELLALVEAIHVVYASPDKHIYKGVDIGRDTLGPIPDALLPDMCDTRRYTDYPDCIKFFPKRDSPLVKLERMSVVRWMGDYWNEHSLVNFDWWEKWDDSDDAWTAFSQFEQGLGLDLPGLGPRFTCRSANLGPLRGYPYSPCDIQVNVLHNPDLDTYGPDLVVGSLNIVYISSTVGRSAEVIFMDEISMIADELVNSFNVWKEYHHPDVVETTCVRFAVHREPPPVRFKASRTQQYDESLLPMWGTLGQELTDTLGIGQDLSLSWDVCWADEEGDCPAC